MVETLFGSSPQLWPTLPAFGYIQTMPGTRPGPFVNAVMPSAPAVAGALSPDPAQMSAGWPAVAPAPTLPTTDFATVITPQALLAAVGMRRGQPMGPANDQEIEDFVSDALDLLAGANDVEIRCEGGRATLAGSVTHKRVKRDVGEIVWAIPSVNDVQNNITITARRRSSRTSREAEAAAAGASRKQA